MRIDVKKFIFVGLEEVKDSFFSACQEAGIIDFIDKRGKKLGSLPSDIENLMRAIKILRGLPTKPAYEVGKNEKIDDLVNQTIFYKQVEENLLEEKRTLELEKARVEIFGHFSKQDIAFIEKEGNVFVQFFFAKEGLYRILKEGSPHLIYIGNDHGLDYFMGVNENLVSLPKMGEIQIEKPLGEIEISLKEVEKKWQENEKKLKEFAKYKEFFHEKLLEKLNGYHLLEAKESSRSEMDESLFYIEGWIPENKISAAMSLAKVHHVHLQEIKENLSDKVPTYLENKGAGKVGEDLVHIYDTPSIHDKDPSLWVLFSFAFFFAFIVNDAGYGAVFLAIALYLRYRFPSVQGGKKRFLRLMTLLGATCIIWGFFTTSFFGIQIGAHNPLRKISIVNWLAKKQITYHIQKEDETYLEWIKKYPQAIEITDANEFVTEAVVTKGGVKEFELLNQVSSGILFELALLTGVVHLILSLARNVRQHFAALGWILVLIGGYLYFPYYLKVASIANTVFHISPESAGFHGLEFMIGGIVIACFFALLQNGLWGLLEITNVVQIFSDTLSYVRLYALGLAGGILSEVINQMAGAVPYFLAAFLIILCHMINIVLSAMGGVIHGLRLNFLEWYHYSFEGGGKAFRALRLLQKEE